ncbi:hypothetical protein [Nocardia miyunensis]|nr:hypothetical protein [Nocardia miyunensis]
MTHTLTFATGGTITTTDAEEAAEMADYYRAKGTAVTVTTN